MTRDSNTVGDAQRCPGCGAANECAIAQGEQRCWCMTEPIGAPLPASDAENCYCKRCLQKLRGTKNSPQLHKPNIPR